MLATACSCGIAGLDVYPVAIEVDVSQGLPATIIVGLPDNAVKESKERVRAAIRNSGYQYKSRRITVNLSPADIKKEGPSFDLPISLGILAATEQIPSEPLKDYLFLGELSLNGNIRPVSGSLPIAMFMASSAFKGIVLPAQNAHEAAIVGNINVFPVKDLREVIHFLKCPESIPPFSLDINTLLKAESNYNIDFADVKGQLHVKRGLEIAAAGGHNCLMIGPPGSGKTMLAKRLPTILPEMTIEEALETTKIHSVMGLIPPGKGLIATRPFRAPHHTASDIALVGGGSIPKPGEITLSHNGILFLDELPEFNRNVIEALRQPLEENYVSISRASKSSRFPASFMLVCSMNPCPCGFYTDPKKECHCSPHQIQRYLSKISGPLLDRIDIHLEVPALKPFELISRPPGESSQDIRERASLARKIQLDRFRDSSTFWNARMTHKQIKHYCELSGECQDLLKRAIEELGLSARAHDKILKISRTIADLDGVEEITTEHLAEAIQYRNLDRNWWG